MPSFRGLRQGISRELSGLGPLGASAGSEASEGFGGRFLAGIKGITSSAGASLVALGQVGVAAIAGVGAGLAAAGGFGLKMAADNEMAAVSFETLLGSSEKAGTFLAQLKEFAATTPFEFPELQKSASQLIAIGISADKVIPIMTSLGNITSGMGTGAEGIQRATVAIQQMNAAGRITAEDLNQLRDAGVPVFDLLTAATGKTKEELAFMAQNGKLGRQELDQLMTALESGKGLERFNGLMEKQSQTLSGLISTLKDRIGQGMADAMAASIPAIKDMIPQITDTIGGLISTIAPVMAQVTQALLPIVQAILPLLGPIVSTLGNLFVSILQPLVPMIQAITPFLQQFIDMLGTSLLNALNIIMPIVAQLVQAFAPILPVLARIGELMIVAFAQTFEQIAPILQLVIGQFVSALVPVLQQMAPLFGELVQAIMPLIPAFFEILKALLPLLPPLLDLGVTIVKALADAFVKLMPALMPLIDAFVQLLGPIIEAITPIIKGLIQAFMPLIPVFLQILNALLPLIPPLLELVSAIGGALAEALRTILPALVPVVQQLVEGLKPVILALVPVIPQLLDALMPLLPVLLDLLVTLMPLVVTVGKWMAMLIELSTSILVPVIGAIAQVAAIILDALKPALETLVEWFGKIGEWFTKIGQWFSEGELGKIADAFKNVMIAIANFFIRAINWIIDKWNGLRFKTPDIPGTDFGGVEVGTPHVNPLEELKSMARGGLLRSGQVAIVGEQGPELWMPRVAGRIVPTPAVAPAASAGVSVGSIEISGQREPKETAFALRTELRWLAIAGGD